MARRTPLAVPATLEPLFGRDDLCGRARAMLSGPTRIVTLVGLGGIGKSRVAHAIAESAAHDSQVPALLCDVGDACDLESVLRAVARSARLGRTDARGEGAVGTAARELAACAPALVVLDNADGVLEALSGFVRPCLEASAGLRFLVTAREPLRIEGERTLEVGPLAAEAARAMFEAMAAGGPYDPRDVSLLLDRLEGIPLAIELAARRALVLPPREMVARFDERFRLLRSDRRDRAVRHASLEAALEGSWERLTCDERRAFAGLALFEGPAELEAFEAVIGPMLDGDPLDVAQALLAKSLLTSVDASGAVRLSMLGTLRAFARDRAADVAEWDAAAARHARYYVDRAGALAARAYGPFASSALDALESNRPNLLMAFERSLANAPERAARIVVSMGDLVLLRNVVDLRSRLFSDARAAADASGEPLLRVQTRVVEARVLLEIGRAADAHALLVEAVGHAERAKRPEAAADARRSLGWALLALGRADEALGVLELALGQHARSADVRGQADALAARGMARCLLGEAARGHRDLESAHALHVVEQDGIRRAKVAEMARLVGLDLDDGAALPTLDVAARLRACAKENRDSGRLWRAALDEVRLAAIDRSTEGRRAHLEAARASASVGGVSEALTAALAAAIERVVPQGARREPWVVGVDSRSVRSSAGALVDLTRHGSLRRVLEALVVRRLAEPGVAMPAAVLLEAGWPGERMRHASGLLRLYTAIRRLRAMGLEDALVTRDDGYLISAEVPVERG